MGMTLRTQLWHYSSTLLGCINKQARDVRETGERALPASARHSGIQSAAGRRRLWPLCARRTARHGMAWHGMCGSDGRRRTELACNYLMNRVVLSSYSQVTRKCSVWDLSSGQDMTQGPINGTAFFLFLGSLRSLHYLSVLLHEH